MVMHFWDHRFTLASLLRAFQGDRPQYHHLHLLLLALFFCAIAVHSRPCPLLALLRRPIAKLVHLPDLVDVAPLTQLLALCTNLDTGALDYAS